MDPPTAIHQDLLIWGLLQCLCPPGIKLWMSTTSAPLEELCFLMDEG